MLWVGLSHGGCSVPPARCQAPPFEPLPLPKPKNKGYLRVSLVFLVGLAGLEPTTSRV